MGIIPALTVAPPPLSSLPPSLSYIICRERGYAATPLSTYPSPPARIQGGEGPAEREGKDYRVQVNLSTCAILYCCYALLSFRSGNFIIVSSGCKLISNLSVWILDRHANRCDFMITGCTGE